MIGKRRFTPRCIASVVVALSLMAAPLGLSTGWAAGYERGGMGSPSSTTGTATPSDVLLDRSPGTIDEYAAHVQNRLQVAAMQMRERGSAELKLTIGKDGAIRDTEVVEVSGAPGLRDQLERLVNRIEPLPALPGNVDTLVVTTDLAFDYPGENLYDRHGRLPRSPG